MASLQSVASASELLNLAIPKKLWHYTSFRGGYGILESQQVFATDTRFLNDSEEFIHAKKLLEEIAEQKTDENEKLTPSIRMAFREELRWLFEDGPLGPKMLQTCVACFSEAEDQLSQWRGYSKDSAGMSLCFDLRKLRESMGRPLAVFAPCIYDDDLKRTLLNDIVEKLFETVATLPRAAWKAGSESANLGKEADVAFDEWSKSEDFTEYRQQLDKARMNASYNLVRVSALMKHRTFSEEQEWRLVIPLLKGFNDKDSPVFFAPGDTTLMPRVKQRLGMDRLPLSELLIGPGGHASAVEATQNYLASLGLPVTPRRSAIPYRTTR